MQPDLLTNWTCKIGKISQCSLYGMIIAYNRKTQKHTLHLSGPYSSDDYTNSMQQILNNMEEVVSQNMDQLFHDIFRLFNKQSISNHELKSSTRKKEKSQFSTSSSDPIRFTREFFSSTMNLNGSWHPHRGFATI